MMEFFAMGGYAPYVWGSFGVMAILLLAEMVQLRLRRRGMVRWLQRMTQLSEQQKESVE